MIKTLKIDSRKDPIPPDSEDYIYVNLMALENETNVYGSRYYQLNPKVLRTDGGENNYNAGGIIFENFWQGSKVYKTVWDIDFCKTNIYGKKDVIFSYRAPSGYTFQDHWDGSKLDSDYFSWRQKVWNCPHPLKSPVGFLKSRRKFEFVLEMDKDGNSQRYDHVIGRQQIFFNEYIRLVYNIPIVNELREMHQNGINIVLCSNDVVKTEKIDILKIQRYFQNKKVPFFQTYALASLLGDFNELDSDYSDEY